MKVELIQKMLDCEITWKKAISIEYEDSYLVKTDNGYIFHINTETVIKAIESCLNGTFSHKDLIDWVNVVRFSDIFNFDEKQQECIISILDRIEESDEDGKTLSDDDLLLMERKLKNNMVW